MKKVTLTNQKGGVAKTTTAYALAIGLHTKGFKVLMIDLDPQSNLSYTAGVDLPNMKYSLYDVFKGTNNVSDIVQTVRPGLDIITAGLRMSSADMEFSGIGREYILRDSIEDIGDNYDYCIIDTPPTLGVLVMNALAASDTVIIPMNEDIYSLQGTAQLNGFIANVKHFCNPNLKISGLLVTKHSDRTVIARSLSEAFEQAAGALKTKVFKTKIREAIAVRESQLAKTDIYTNAAGSTSTEDYRAFVDEFIQED